MSKSLDIVPARVNRSRTMKYFNLALVLLLLMPALNLTGDLSIHLKNDKGYFSQNEFEIEPYSKLGVIYYPEGNYTGNIYWNSTDNFVITGNISINGSLFIQPGVLIDIDGDYSISINGSIIASGSKLNTIKFRPKSSNPTTDSWQGIIIEAPGYGKIDHVVISFAKNGLVLNNTDNLTVLNSQMNYCSEAGLRCNNIKNTTITNNSFSYNDQYAIKVQNAMNSSFEYNTISVNHYGIHVNNSYNNSFLNNSMTNKIQNSFDDGNNSWDYNYYNNYLGIDKNSDNIGETELPYLIPGGDNNDTHPRTKIYYHNTLWGFASLKQAVINSTASNNIMLLAKTPGAGSQSIDQEGYYYENLMINSSIGHDVTIIGPSSSVGKVTLDGSQSTCIEVEGNYKINLVSVTIINSDIAVFLHNGAANSNLGYLKVQNNVKGIVLDNVSFVQIANSTIRNNNGPNSLGGIYLSYCKQINIENNKITSNKFGISLANSSNNILLNNTCNSNLEIGLRLNYSTGNIITKNVFNSNEKIGMELSEMSNDNKLYGNSYLNNIDGLVILNSSSNLFTASRITANQYRGIYFDYSSNNNTFNRIQPGTFSGSLIGIESNRSHNNWFTNCTMAPMNIWLDINSSMTFLNNTFSDQYVLTWDSLSKFTVINYVNVKIINSSGYPKKPAWVEVYDNKTDLIENKSTDSSGFARNIKCISYIQTQNGRDYSYNPHYITGYDGISDSSVFANITQKTLKILVFNYFPVFQTQNVVTAQERSPYYAQYSATTNELDQTLYWRFSTNTSDWLRFNGSSLTLSGIPSNRDVGRPWVNISVWDTDGDLATSNFTLNIKNSQPEIITENVLSVYEDGYYYVDYNSTDDDGYLNLTGHIVYPDTNLTSWSMVSTASEWLKFDNESGILSGNPNNLDVGVYPVYIFVFDGNGMKNTTYFDLEVINVAPEIVTDDVSEVFKNEEYYNDYNSSDDGQGIISWKFETNADWLYFDEMTGELNGTPRQKDVGEWWVNVTVKDDHGGRTNRNITIKVKDNNVPPKIVSMNRETAYTDVEYLVQYSAIDEDTPIELLIWGLSENTEISNATWLTMDPKTGELRGTPLRRHIGWYWVTVTVMDNAGGEDFTTFRIDVLLSPDKPPELLTVLTDVSKKSSDTWKKEFTAIDDYTAEDDLIWSLRSDASWLSINSSTGIINIQFDQSMTGTYWVNVSVTDELGQFNFTNFTLNVQSTNNAPVLSKAGMTPATGNVDTVFTFFVTYTDQDNDSGIVKVVIDGEEYLMKPDPTQQSRFHKGVNFTLEKKLSKGKHEYYFIAEDKWNLLALYSEDIPSKTFPKQSEEIKEIVETPYYSEPTFLFIIVIIVIIFLLLFLMLIRPERFNPVVRARLLQEREELGEFGYICPTCKNLIPDDAKKCDNCGERFVEQEYVCPDCQVVVKASDVFCPHCGAKFEELDLDELEPEFEDDSDEDELNDDSEDSEEPEDEDDNADATADDLEELETMDDDLDAEEPVEEDEDLEPIDDDVVVDDDDDGEYEDDSEPEPDSDDHDMDDEEPESSEDGPDDDKDANDRSSKKSHTKKRKTKRRLKHKLKK